MNAQMYLQDLEVQNLELVEFNEKLQKEVAALRSLAKEALLEKKKSQAALEAFKHQVSHIQWSAALNVTCKDDEVPAEHGKRVTI